MKLERFNQAQNLLNKIGELKEKANIIKEVLGDEITTTNAQSHLQVRQFVNGSGRATINVPRELNSEILNLMLANVQRKLTEAEKEFAELPAE